MRFQRESALTTRNRPPTVATRPRRTPRYGDLRPESGLKTAEKLFTSRRAPTAILTSNDQMAIGTMRGIVLCGLEIPRQVSVVGFDDITLASFVIPALTAMALPQYQVRVAAGEMILRHLAGVDQPRDVWFTPKLVVRESSAQPDDPGRARISGGGGIYPGGARGDARLARRPNRDGHEQSV